jgi:hypothetical protein
MSQAEHCEVDSHDGLIELAPDASLEPRPSMAMSQGTFGRKRSVPVWQHVLAILLVLAAIYVLVRLAGRIYGQALLRSGRRLSLPDALHLAGPALERGRRP